jgi:hypothetical protein
MIRRGYQGESRERNGVDVHYSRFLSVHSKLSRTRSQGLFAFEYLQCEDLNQSRVAAMAIAAA